MADFNDGLDGKLACRMRKVNSEQFHTLVRMHLSFELDLNTEDDIVAEKAKLKKWGILSFSKKPKSTINLQKGIESTALTKKGIDQVKHLIEYLSKEPNILQEGIFRRTGKLTRQQELKTALYQGLPLNLDDGRFSVHDCASVLKGFLADLSEPLLTDLHYPTHYQIAELCSNECNGSESRLLTSLQLLLLLLPSSNRIVLKHILNLLNKTAAFGNRNKMNCNTLATLFTPHLMCPRKLTPEALHVNSQNLSGLVAFMIKKGIELFEIPQKLSTDIRAFWIEQEKKLLSPVKSDMNESTVDMTGMAHTVFSFVDRNLTAQATATQDTQAALAQLYAHIQSMPDSAKKRRLIKQFNKENGQGTPRHIKQNGNGSKSFGDSIKKRIFQKKLLRHKKVIDIKLGCNFSRSNSEENMLSNTFQSSQLLSKIFSKSEDQLSDVDRYDVVKEENLPMVKHMSNSTGSLNTPCLCNYKKKTKVILKSFLNLSERSTAGSPNDEKNLQKKKGKLSRYLRHQSEPLDLYSSPTSCIVTKKDSMLVRQTSEPSIPIYSRSPTVSEIPKKSRTILIQQQQLHKQTTNPSIFNYKSSCEDAAFLLSPTTKDKLRCLYAAHTSTPSKLLEKSLAMNEHYLTPITDGEKSMSPITQSTTKMTKSMQETMMTPRSRKPVIMVSTSNLCGLATLNNSSKEYDSNNSLQNLNFNLLNRKNYCSIFEESPSFNLAIINKSSNLTKNKENIKQSHISDEQCYTTCLDEIYGSTIRKSTTISVTNTFKEYFLSRSVLTASPVDLSFTSRTGDFEQSESEFNVLADHNLCSNTSGIISGSTNSMNNSADKMEETFQSSKKRCTSLHRNDSKCSIKKKLNCEKLKNNKILKQKQLSESMLISVKVKDPIPDTSF